MFYILLLVLIILFSVFLVYHNNQQDEIWKKKIKKKLKANEQQILYIVGANNYLNNFMMKVDKDARVTIKILPVNTDVTEPFNVFNSFIEKQGTGVLHIGYEDKAIYGATFYISSDVDVNVEIIIRGFLI